MRAPRCCHSARRVVLALLVVLIAQLMAASTADAADLWTRVGLAGSAISHVDVDTEGSGSIDVVANGTALTSDDAGLTWHASRDVVGPLPATWWVKNGFPVHAVNGDITHDATAPSDVVSVTAPAALDGYAVAATANGEVWRRAPTGDWAQALLLLPTHLGAASPRALAVASFDTEPLSTAVYVATDGYGVLLSQNGGEDWLRFDTGLPADVSDIATDPDSATVYAATNDGLWTHHLQVQPGFATYADAAYWWRVAGIAAVALVAVGCALAVLMRRDTPKSPHALA